jgi:hypothetical protein
MEVYVLTVSGMDEMVIPNFGRTRAGGITTDLMPKKCLYLIQINGSILPLSDRIHVSLIASNFVPICL